MEELIVNGELLANFAKAIYKDVEQYINEQENSKKDFVKYEI